MIRNGSYTIADLKPFHGFPYCINDPPTFVSKCAWLRRVLRPWHSLPGRQIRGAHTAALQFNPNLSTPWYGEFHVFKTQFLGTFNNRRAHGFPTVHSWSSGLIFCHPTRQN